MKEIQIKTLLENLIKRVYNMQEHKFLIKNKIWWKNILSIEKIIKMK